MILCLPRGHRDSRHFSGLGLAAALTQTSRGLEWRPAAGPGEVGKVGLAKTDRPSPRHFQGAVFPTA